MSKGKIKKRAYPPRDPAKTIAVKLTAASMQCTSEYVRALINGNNNADAGRGAEILKAYRKKYAELKQVLS